MTLYIGVDIHARQQTLSYLDTEDGTTGRLELQHERDDVKGFYCKFQGEVIIGIEACGYTNWFEELIEQLGHKLLVGDAAEIRRLARRRQKNDRRDADLLMDLLGHVLSSSLNAAVTISMSNVIPSSPCLSISRLSFPGREMRHHHKACRKSGPYRLLLLSYRD